MTPTPIVEHWPDAELEFAAEHPEGLDPGIVQAVASELERRAAARAREQRAREEAQEAREKIQMHEEAQRRSRALERAREESLRHAPATAPRDALARIIRFCDIAPQYHAYGFRHAAFALEVVQQMLIEGREAEFTELMRGTDWGARWSYTHPSERSVIVMFDEVFPASRTRKRNTESAAA